MKLRLMGFVLAFLLIAGLFPAGGANASGSIQWYNYETGMALGKKENKKIFLHFWAEWCDSCKIMAKETFTDSAVIAYLNKNFIAIKVNSDKEKSLVSEYNVRGLPDNWFIAEKNEVIGNQPGNIPPDRLLPLLRYIQSNSYKKMSFGRFLEAR